jgi:hypothetical protein
MREKRVHPVLNLGTDPCCNAEYKEEMKCVTIRTVW